MKFNEIKIIYSCPASPPENVYLDRIYSIGKDNKGLYFTDGNYLEYSEEWYIKMLFTPKECKWQEVDFKDEVKVKAVDKSIK